MGSFKLISIRDLPTVRTLSHRMGKNTSSISLWKTLVSTSMYMTSMVGVKVSLLEEFHLVESWKAISKLLDGYFPFLSSTLSSTSIRRTSLANYHDIWR
jgi:hypothetical protein